MSTQAKADFVAQVIAANKVWRDAAEAEQEAEQRAIMEGGPVPEGMYRDDRGFVFKIPDSLHDRLRGRIACLRAQADDLQALHDALPEQDYATGERIARALHL